MIALQFLVVIAAILLGARLSGVGLGVMGGLGLAILVFIFGLRPTTAPIDVMLMILAVITTAGCLQAAGCRWDGVFGAYC
ncbi:anaerobic C4-dicarboxylate transporter family protein [Iodobacter fluviatilis]|uniref:anaerobic C4-dicarboxylate transporter family protein n=1 Tax=Iodobacter fluviatilis TaxID=537 RepID=UPI0027E454CD|nr:anaerobic C4-dicarboxylate transporter family protein [Iodobacter fluviatilis]